MARPAYLTIDPLAYQHNLTVLKNTAPHSKLVAVVKANAYGHGVENLIHVLNEMTTLAGVCCLEEAVQLRQKGYKHSILLLEGFFESAELEWFEQENLIPVIHQEFHLHALKTYPFTKPQQVWLKINTGLNRLGISVLQVPHFIQNIQLIPALKPFLPVLMTHFASADNMQSQASELQMLKFSQVIHSYPYEVSMANSAATLAWPKSHGQWIRPGLSSYGISPFTNKTGIDLGLKPVMKLHSKIIAIQNCQVGDQIGYCGRYICDKPMKVGIVAIGYADGYPQQAADGTPVIVNGQKTGLVGRVSMDMLTVDLTDIPDANVGSPVTLWGPELPVEIIAQHAKTTAYELICGVSNRLQKMNPVKTGS